MYTSRAEDGKNAEFPLKMPFRTTDVRFSKPLVPGSNPGGCNFGSSRSGEFRIKTEFGGQGGKRRTLFLPTRTPSHPWTSGLLVDTPTGKNRACETGNRFKPDIDILSAAEGMFQVKVNGVDVFHPNTGEVRSDNADGIACWFIDTDYNEESFFVRHAYFLGANDPYKSLKTTLKAEIDEEAWATLNSDVSRPFEKPKSGRIAVKVINHLGDEVMKVFKVT